MKKTTVTLALLALLLAAGPAFAATPEQNKLLAKRAAEIDAYRNLAEIIKGFQIDSRTIVRDFVTESDEINTEFREFIKGAKVVGEPRYFDDDTCEVDVQITIEEVVTKLKTIVKEIYDGRRWVPEKFEKLYTTVTTRTITATGAGAPRPERDDELNDDFISPPPKGTIKRLPVPPNWEDVDGQQRLMARRAALTDARRNLAESVKGFRIDSSTTVKDFVTQSDVINTSLSTFLRGVQVVEYRYNSDELIVECDVQITLEEVITYLKRTVKAFNEGGRWYEKIFESVRTETTRKLVTATGYGTIAGKPAEKPAPVVQPEPAPVVEEEPGIPEWAARTITATGEAVPSEDAESEAAAKRGAKRTAKIEAVRKLGEVLDGVQIDSKTTVEDFVTESDEIETKSNAFVRGARVVKGEWTSDGTYKVTVELKLIDFYNKIYKKYQKE